MGKGELVLLPLAVTVLRIHKDHRTVWRKPEHAQVSHDAPVEMFVFFCVWKIANPDTRLVNGHVKSSKQQRGGRQVKGGARGCNA